MTNPKTAFTSLAVATLFIVPLTACTTNNLSGNVGGTGAVVTSISPTLMNISDVVSQLQSQGVTADMNGQQVQQPFFGATGQEIHVNGQTVQVYQYSDDNTSKADADKISDDGMSINGTAVHWAGPPHFFQKDNLLILYVGSDQKVIKALENTVGIQFAGASDTGTGSGATTGTGARTGMNNPNANPSSY